jgi:hypothetical protein
MGTMVQIDIEFPDRDRLESVTDATPASFPPFTPAVRERELPTVDDVPAATRAALDDLPALDDLAEGARVAVTAGSRGIHDMPAVLRAAVEGLRERGLDPFVMPAMGSHGGATAEGQVETLASLGVTESSLGCEIRSSMAVERVGTDDAGDPVWAAEDALAADAVLLVNRIKLHTDYDGRVESGLCKMAVVGLGKHRGAEAMHNAALARGFDTVIPERAAVLFEETPVVGGVALVDNADERAAHVEGVPVDRILDREPELLDYSADLFPRLPVDDLDLLVVDEAGKNVSGTLVDTNVIGRVRFHGQPEPDEPSITRIHVRRLTPESHGNALGVGLADFAHRRVVEALDLGDTYVNVATSGEPRRASLPFVVPADATAFVLATSMTGVTDPAELRVALIRNTLEPERLLVSDPVRRELEPRDDVRLGDPRPLSFDEAGDLDGAFDRLDEL